MSTAELKIMVIGRSGQVARDLQTVLPSIGSVTCVGRPEVDLAKPESIRGIIRDRRPDVLINAAAYTAVDMAESEPELAMKINAEAPGIMADEAKRLGALFVSYSSDYVFDGTKAGPYTEEDEPNPLNIYGASKLAGDRAVQAVGGSYLIFRTSWVYSAHGKNFLKTILKLSTERAELRIVDDQIGAPTWSRDIADATAKIISQVACKNRLINANSPSGNTSAGLMKPSSGIYNLTAGGSVSWCGFARAIVEEIGKYRKDSPAVARIIPIPTFDYPTPAQRPLNSRLDSAKVHQTFGVLLPAWQESMTAVFHESGNAAGDFQRF